MASKTGPVSPSTSSDGDAFGAGTAVGRWREYTNNFRSIISTTPWTAIVGLGVFLVIVGLVIAAPLVARFDPTEQALLHRLQLPSSIHWLGTDHLGRDVFSRLLYGGRFSLTIAAITVAISAIAGAIIGAISGYVGRLLDDITMRIVDLLIPFPEVVVALLVMAMLGPGFTTLIIALTIIGWTPFARLARGLTLSIKTQGYIEAARAQGCSPWFVIHTHVLPNALKPLLSHTFLRFGHKLIAVGALSFLGLGVQPPNSDWGAMLADALPYMQRVPTLILAPGLAIFVSALAITVAGQGVEIMLDPKRRVARQASKKRARGHEYGVL